ncbi:MAG: ABC transporter ATP-binding protein [Chloroflexota bacterium]
MNNSLQAYRSILIDYLRPQRGRMVALAILIFANIGLQLVNPQIMRRFIDSALTRENTEQLGWLALLFIAIALVQQIVAVGSIYVGENVSWMATNWLRYDLARHCLNLDMSFHNRYTPGAMIERIDGDINTLSLFFSQFVLQVIGNGLLLIGILALLWRESLLLGAVLTFFVIVVMTVLIAMRSAAIPQWKKSRQASADFFGFLEERLAGTEEIRSSGAKAYVMRRFAELLRAFWQTTVRARLLAFAMTNIGWLLFTIGVAATYGISANLFSENAMTIGSVYLVVHYAGLLNRPIQRIAAEIEQLQQAGAGVARIQEFLAEENGLARSDTEQTLPEGSLPIAFEGVSFAYPMDATLDSDNGRQDAPPRTEKNTDNPELLMAHPEDASEDEVVLDDITFRLEAGKVLGLLGRTGSGKTTLARLLFRFYDPTAGTVYVGGENVANLDVHQLRQRIGIVTQNVQLFHTTVRDNMTFFNPELPDAALLEVLDELGLSSWLASLDDGLDTVLEAGGGNLSAGEAQLLALTRIFLKNPDIVIFDEASSRLDPATEQRIELAVDRLLNNRTAIIIAHRLATVQRADEIMILERGRIVEHGERVSLSLDSGSRFAGLLKSGLEADVAPS